jgi:hypothetical protein
LVLSPFTASLLPGFLPPLKIGTNEPESLFFGITNPDLAANKETFGPLVVDALDEALVAVILIL